MKLTKQDLTKVCNVAVDAARQSGQLIQSYSNKVVDILEKRSEETAASQVVTEVDFKSQDLILSKIKATTLEFDFGLLAEEDVDDLSRFKKDFFWCIDPLDGTLAFIKGYSGYAVSIALVSREGQPIIGVVYDPSSQTLYQAISGQGVLRNNESWTVLNDEVASVSVLKEGGAVMKACWVLEKSPAYFLKQPKPKQGGGCLWDYAATACIFAELGAWVSDAKGNPLNLNHDKSFYMNHCGVLYASNRKIAEKILEKPS